MYGCLSCSFDIFLVLDKRLRVFTHCPIPHRRFRAKAQPFESVGEGGFEQGFPEAVGCECRRDAIKVREVALHVENKTGLGRHGEEADGVWLTGFVGGCAILVVVALVRRHDFHGEAVALDLGNHVPEHQRTAQVLGVAFGGFAAKQRRDRGIIPAVRVAPIAQIE